MINSRYRRFSATPSSSSGEHLHPTGAHLLPKLRCHFAEFLSQSSLTRLRMLSSPTCVGLRYDHLGHSLEDFLVSVGSITSAQLSLVITPRRLRESPVLPKLPAYTLKPGTTIARLTYPPASPHRSKRNPGGAGILTGFPSPTPFGLGLGCRLTLGGRTLPRKP